VCFPDHPDRAFRINFVKRTFSHSVVSAGEADLMDLMEEHVKKEYGADVFSRDDFVYSVSSAPQYLFGKYLLQSC